MKGDEIKRVAFLIFILILCFIGIYYYLKSDGKNIKWTNPEAWNKIEKDMTYQQVEELLGKPGQIISRGGGTRWYYQDLPREIHKEPSHGYVFFRPEHWTKYSSTPPEEWTVYEWVEPNWSRINIEKNTK